MSETNSSGVDIGDRLRTPLADALVMHLEQGPSRGAPYLETYVAINQANDIFGFDGWGYGVTRLERVASEPAKTSNGREYQRETWMAQVRVTALGVVREDVGIGVTGGPEGADMAIKGAISDGLKRALRTFGAQFGNELYNKQSPQRGGNRGGRPGPRATAPAANRTRAAASGAARPERPAAAAAAVAGDGPDPRLGRFPNVGAFLSEVTSELNMKRADVFKIANLLDRAPPAALLDYDGGLDELYQACVQAPLAEVAE